MGSHCHFVWPVSPCLLDFVHQQYYVPSPAKKPAIFPSAPHPGLCTRSSGWRHSSSGAVGVVSYFTRILSLNSRLNSCGEGSWKKVQRDWFRGKRLSHLKKMQDQWSIKQSVFINQQNGWYWSRIKMFFSFTTRSLRNSDSNVTLTAKPAGTPQWRGASRGSNEEIDPTLRPPRGRFLKQETQTKRKATHPIFGIRFLISILTFY